MGATVYVGLASSAHNNARINVGILDQVAVLDAAALRRLPTPKSDGKILRAATGLCPQAARKSVLVQPLVTLSGAVDRGLCSSPVESDRCPLLPLNVGCCLLGPSEPSGAGEPVNR
jgi:hypothetical protein